MTLNMPFDIRYWFMNVFAGTPDIFIALSLIALLLAAATFRMNFAISLMMFALFAVFIGANAGVWYAAVIVFVFGLLGYFLYRAFNR